ncbi:uncharacterized protein (TIGR02246 family) [Mycoplana dimorpha]|uniref:Uncharacterized protein (TIGR02246 family) n=2 Tax=Mycoplana dimorpha TaxID=28320 RepID=A0A2T5BF40_MYCDI|nr:uncharacterized protein (TIGR02246 family) [Mycoplana dimorpha]
MMHAFAFLVPLTIGVVMAADMPVANSDDGKQQIMNNDEAWLNAVAANDPKAIAAFYAEDGAILAPGMPIAKGRDAVEAAWKGFVGMKDFSLTFSPSLVDVAQSGDLAYEIGTYELGYSTDKPVHDRGKYVVVWKKSDEDWKVMADIFNSDGAM